MRPRIAVVATGGTIQNRITERVAVDEVWRRIAT